MGHLAQASIRYQSLIQKTSLSISIYLHKEITDAYLETPWTGIQCSSTCTGNGTAIHDFFLQLPCACDFLFVYFFRISALPYPTPSLTKRLARIPYELDKIYMDWKEMFTLIFKSFVFATMLQKEKAVNGSKLWRYSAEKPAKWTSLAWKLFLLSLIKAWTRECAVFRR